MPHRTVPHRIMWMLAVAWVAALFMLWPSLGLCAELKIGQKAPNFELPTIFGDSTYTSRDLFSQDTLTVLILWTSYCQDCWKALKSCHDLSEKVMDRGVRVIGINFDTERLATARGFIKGEKIDFVNLSDFHGSAVRAYRAESYDFSTFIVDKNGILKYVSYDHPPDIDRVILKKIEEMLGSEERTNEKKDEKKRSKEPEPDRDRKV